MKEVFRKLMALVMAVVVVCSTMSFTIDMHYCGGFLVDSAMFQKAATCGMDMENSVTDGCSTSKKNCCNNEQLIVKGQDELQFSLAKIAFDQHVFIASFVYTYSSLFTSSDKNVTFYKDYKPPLVIRQIYKIDETYLI